MLKPSALTHGNKQGYFVLLFSENQILLWHRNSPDQWKWGLWGDGSNLVIPMKSII